MTQTQINKIALAAIALSLALFVASAPAHAIGAHAVTGPMPAEASTLSQVLLDADFKDGHEFDG